MTIAFAKFMAQHQKSGSEKADGYSSDVFIGLDEAERSRVFDLLVGELPYSVEWLFFLNPDEALPIVKEEAGRLRGNGYASAYLLHEELARRTGDMSYQDQMIDDFPGYADRLKPLVVDAVGRTPASVKSITFFRHVILTEINDSVIARAAYRLLGSLRVPRDTEAEEKAYKQYMNDLRSGSYDVKLRALSQLEIYSTPE